jgi:hypothetical protein
MRNRCTAFPLFCAVAQDARVNAIVVSSARCDRRSVRQARCDAPAFVARWRAAQNFKGADELALEVNFLGRRKLT